MSECSHDCSSCSQNCAERTDPQSLLQAPHAQSDIRKVIGVCSGKGGVGKSMVTSLLAVLLRRMGLKVGILDADITGPSIPRAFGMKEHAEGTDEGLFPVTSKTGIDVMSLNLLLENETDPVIWRGPVIAGAVTQFWTDVIWGPKEVLLIDMPPGTGDVMLTVFQSIPIDGIILVTSPQELVGMIVKKALKMATTMNVPVLGLVENMSFACCPDCDKEFELFGKSKADEIAKQFGIPNVARMPISPKLAGGVDAGMIELFNGEWLDNIAKAIDELPEKKDA